MTGRVLVTIELEPNGGQTNLKVDLSKFNNGLYAYTLVLDGKTAGTKMLQVTK